LVQIEQKLKEFESRNNVIEKKKRKYLSKSTPPVYRSGTYIPRRERSYTNLSTLPDDKKCRPQSHDLLKRSLHIIKEELNEKDYA
jgi:hypothetical protein